MGFVSKLLSFGADKDLKRYRKTVERVQPPLLSLAWNSILI